MSATRCPRLKPLVLSFSLLLGLTACGDDDAPADAGPGSDDGAMDASRHDDASMPMDASRMDSGPAGDSGMRDAGDACPHERFPLWDTDNDTPFGATRVPLELLCGRLCDRSLAEFAASFDCQPVPEDAGVDAIADDLDAGPFGLLLRSDGCGSVQFGTLGESWPRYYNFDPDSGELIGYARLDDIGEPLAGTSCEAASWVGGVIRHSCDDETLSVCVGR